MILFVLLFFLNVSIALSSINSNAIAKQNDIRITHGSASGDITNHSAVIWSKSNTNSLMHVKYDTNSNFTNPIIFNNTQIVNNITDYTGSVKLDDLKPNTQYYYQVWFSSPNNKSDVSNNLVTGLFHTAPDPSHQKNNITFIVGGDLGGQKYCERVGLGYPIFSVMRDLSPDFFIFNGDQIYADGECPAKGPDDVTGWHNMQGNFSSVSAKDVNWTNINQIRYIYNNHWKYNRPINIKVYLAILLFTRKPMIMKL